MRHPDLPRRAHQRPARLRRTCGSRPRSPTSPARRPTGSARAPTWPRRSRRRRSGSWSTSSPGRARPTPWPHARTAAPAAARDIARPARSGSRRPRRRRTPRGPDPQQVRRPPLVERRERGCGRSGRGRAMPRPARPPRRTLGELALRGPRQIAPRLRRDGVDLADGVPEERERTGRRRRSPRRSRPPMPPGRVTRPMSRSPATGSAMKCTTSWARAASKAPSSYGQRLGRRPRGRRAPGNRSRAAATNDGDGSTAATAALAVAGDEDRGEHARAAADVEHRSPGDPTSALVDELRRRGARTTGP